MPSPSGHRVLNTSGHPLRGLLWQKSLSLEWTPCVAPYICLVWQYTNVYELYRPYTYIYKHYTSIYGCENYIRMCTYSPYSVRMLFVYAFVYCLYDARITLYSTYTSVFFVENPLGVHIRIIRSIQTFTDNIQTTYRQHTDSIQTHTNSLRSYTDWAS